MAGLRSLPGVGSYTAAAVASIAWDVPVPLVDGNVARVLCRLHAIPGDPRRGAARAAVEAAAASLLNRRHPGDHNQALMELGALVCLPRAPRCAACPLAPACRAHASGAPESFPARRPSKPAVRVRLAAGVARRLGRLVLVEDTRLVPGHLVVPLVETADGLDPREALRAAWPELAGRRAARLEPAGVVRHSVLERRYEVEVFAVVEAPAARGPGRPRLVLPARLEETPRGGLLAKVLSVAAGRETPPRPARASRGPAPPTRRGG